MASGTGWHQRVTEDGKDSEVNYPKIQVTGALAAIMCVAGCVAQPGPAPVQPDGTVTVEATPTPEVPADKKMRSEVIVGIDQVQNGFNPHLLADDSAFVQSLARLVLPSAFVDGELNRDLLVDAAELPPAEGAAQTIQYRINPEAQWSDGSPITGADFHYLWVNMKNTPGVINPAGYQAIREIRMAEGGKLVTVYFSSPIANWKELFQHLLPSHLLSIGTDSFDKVLANQVPASAGQYMVRGIDRRRGVIELARNDRFWGAAPAKIELLTFQELTSVSQAIEMMRSGQLSFANVTPSETSMDALRLTRGLETRLVNRDSRLEASFNTKALPQLRTRQAIAGLVDIPLVARLAAGRSADLALATAVPMPKVEEAELDAIKRQLGRPLRIGADPADRQAIAAAVAIADMLRAAGFDVQVLQSDLGDLTGRRIPAAEVDIVVNWQRIPDTALESASRLACAQEDKAVGNISAWCNTGTNEFLAEALAGSHDNAAVSKYVQDLTAEEVLALPIMIDRRIEVLGSGIVGPSVSLQGWPEVPDASAMALANTWKDEGR